MKFSEIFDQQVWDKQIGSQKMSQFLQSWSWSKFNADLKIKTYNLEIDGEYILILVKPLIMSWNYLYLPRTNLVLRPTVYNALKKIAQENKAVFVRIDSALDKTETTVKLFQTYYGRRSKDVQPSKTLFLDLTQSEEQLLAQMHPKTRYNIRLAEKKGIICREARTEEFDLFWRLISKTYKRQGIITHTKDYYQNMLKACDFMKLFLAEYQGQVIVANLVCFFGDTVTYLHGGSDDEFKNVMAPHLLQWYQIRLGKNQGYKFYDFFGIDELKWPGVTRFKKGFGGFEHEFTGTWDVVIEPFKYRFYELLRIINLRIRKLFK